jgi:hypothetical protein
MPCRDRGESHPENDVGGQLVERAFLAHRGGIVAQRRKPFRDEQIVDRIAVGTGAAEADHVPDVVHRGACDRKQNGADLRCAIASAASRAVRFDDLDMGAEPVRLTGAAGEVPAAIGAIAARHHLHLTGNRTPGQDVGRRTKYFARRIGIEIGRGHGADAALAEAPCCRGVGLRHFLEHLHEHFERRFGAARAFRQQGAIQPVLDQAGNHRWCQTPRPFDLVGLARDHWRQRSRTLDQVDTGKLVHAFPRGLCGSS